MPVEFPEIIKIAQALDAVDERQSSLQFDGGDALIARFGAPGLAGQHNGVESVLKRLVGVLNRLKLHRVYTLAVLRAWRTMAAKWPADTRVSGASWSVHRAANNRDTLIAVMEQAKADGEELTVGYINKFMSKKRQERAKRQRQQNDKLRDQEPPDLAAERAKTDWLMTLTKVREQIDAAMRVVKKHNYGADDRAEMASDLQHLAQHINDIGTDLFAVESYREAAE